MSGATETQLGQELDRCRAATARALHDFDHDASQVGVGEERLEAIQVIEWCDVKPVRYVQRVMGPIDRGAKPEHTTVVRPVEHADG